MSRFDDDLDRDLTVIAERVTPSPDAWAEIQQRIANRQPETETEIIMLTENTLTRRRWPLVAAAAAVAALAIGAIALFNRDDGAEQPADVPTPTVAPAPEPETGSDVSPLPAEGEALPPGRYAPFTLGIPVVFEVPGTATGWTVQVNDDVAVTIGPEGSFVNMSRLGSLYDATESEDPDFIGLGSVPPVDVDAWIEANGVIVVDNRDVTIDGRSAKLRQVRAPDGAGLQTCPAEIQPCVRFSSASADLQDAWNLPSVVAYGPLPHSFWVVELDDFEPLGIWAHTDTGEPQSWFEEVQPVIDSIELGEPAPVTEFGQARLSTFGAGTGDLPEAGQPTSLTDLAEGDPMPASSYTSDKLGVPVTFDVPADTDWMLRFKSAYSFDIGTNSSFVAMTRLGSFYDAEEAVDPDMRAQGSIPADDIDGFIVANGLIVEDSREATIGGRPASFRQLRLPDGTGEGLCPAALQPCLQMGRHSADLQVAPVINIGGPQSQSFWVVDMDGYEPFGIYIWTRDPDGPQAWLDALAPLLDSITFGEPAPAVEGGTARLPERQQFLASYTGTRTVGPELEDGTREVIGQNTVEGDLTGEIVATGVQITPTNGTDDLVFTGTIDGLGTGTLTMKQEWTASNNDIATRTLVVGGTGDFEGITGRVFTSVDVPDESGPSPVYSGRMTFELALPER